MKKVTIQDIAGGVGVRRQTMAKGVHGGGVWAGEFWLKTTIKALKEATRFTI